MEGKFRVLPDGGAGLVYVGECFFGVPQLRWYPPVWLHEQPWYWSPAPLQMSSSSEAYFELASVR